MKTEWSADRLWHGLGVGVAALAALILAMVFVRILMSPPSVSRSSTSPLDDEFAKMMAELGAAPAPARPPALVVLPPNSMSGPLKNPVATAPKPQPVAVNKITTPQNDPAANPAPMIDPILFPPITPAEIAEVPPSDPDAIVEKVEPSPTSPAATPSPMIDPLGEPALPLSSNPQEAGLVAREMEKLPALSPAAPLVEQAEGKTMMPGAVPDTHAATTAPKENPDPSSLPQERLADASRAPQEAVEDCRKAWSGNREDLIPIRKKAALQPAGFSIAFRDLINPYGLMSTMCLPGETVEVKAVVPRGVGNFEILAEGGTVTPKQGELLVWSWVVPKNPGMYCLQITNRDTGGTMCLHGLVCVPYQGEERLEGYNVGEYQKKPLNNNLRYSMPRGLFRVTQGMEDIWLSPHFQLRQFLCKQPSDYPKFVLVESRLLLKLEALVEGLEQRGIKEDSVFVASGYRTPAYNKALGNTTIYSRHLYGDAADILVDQDRDASLDDLNADGKVDARDTVWLTNLVADITTNLPAAFDGGLGLYPFKSPRTAFIHTDTRGEPTRWGFPQARRSFPSSREACADAGCGHASFSGQGLLVGVVGSE